MEHAYRIEVGLEAAPKKRQQGKEVKEDQEDLQGGKDTAQHTMVSVRVLPGCTARQHLRAPPNVETNGHPRSPQLTRGEQDAAREEALMTDIVSQVEKERAERMKKNKEKMAQARPFVTLPPATCPSGDRLLTTQAVDLLYACAIAAGPLRRCDQPGRGCCQASTSVTQAKGAPRGAEGGRAQVRTCQASR